MQRKSVSFYNGRTPYTRSTVSLKTKDTNRINGTPFTRSDIHFKKFNEDEQLSDGDDQQDVINLNYFKVKSKTTHFNLQQMLQQGKIQEDETDHNPHYPSPSINSKLIHSIFGIVHNDKPTLEHKQKLKLDTVEKQLKQTNKKIVNQILFNKLRTRKFSMHDATTTTTNVLQSFKSLTTMFKSVYQLVDYNQIANQIRQSSTQIKITKETEQNLERQQYNFNYIIAGRISLLKSQGLEITEQQIQLKNLRMEICTLREQITEGVQQLMQIKQKYIKQRMVVSANQNRNIDKLQVISTLGETEKLEKNRISTYLAELKLKQEEAVDLLRKQEELLKDMKATKKNTKQDFSEFLKQVLQCEDIQIEDNLGSIVKLLLQINESVAFPDFPNFLDNSSRQHVLQKAQLELKLEEYKQQIKDNKQINTPTQSNRGNRPFYEQKLQEVMTAFRQMKKQRSTIKIINQECEQAPIIVENKNIMQLQLSTSSLPEIEEEIHLLDDQEIERLQFLYSGKQLPNSSLQKLIKTVQALWGYKLMNNKLSLIIANYTPAKQIDGFDQSQTKFVKKVVFK